MAAAFVAVVAVGIVYTLSLTPRYTATSTVLFDAQNQSALDLAQLLNQQAGPPVSIANQIQIITSSSFVGKVIDKLNLSADPEFGAAGTGGFGIVKSIKGLFGDDAQNGPSKDEEHIATINRFLDRMVAGVADGTSVITIQFSSQDPSKAAAIANAVADGYITDQLEAKFEATRIERTSGRIAQARGRGRDRRRQLRGGEPSADPERGRADAAGHTCCPIER